MSAIYIYIYRLSQDPGESSSAKHNRHVSATSFATEKQQLIIEESLLVKTQQNEAFISKSNNVKEGTNARVVNYVVTS